MIRHSSSLFISIVIHISLLFVFLWSWKSLPPLEKKEQEFVRIKLSNIQEQKQKIEEVQETVKMPNIPLPQKKLVPKKEKKKTPQKKQELPKPIVMQEEPKVLVQEIKDEAIVKEEAPQNAPALTQPKVQNIQQDYLDENIQQIAKLLQENLYYPRSARQRGVEGEVVVKFSLSTTAKTHSIEIISSSNEILSRAAVKTIQDLSGKFPKPSEELVLQVPIRFSLK